MKKTFKIKALVLCMIAMMVIGLVPSVNAAPYENTIEEAEAKIVCSLMADKTDVKPGDTLTVTFALDEVPQGGVVAVNARLLYDSSKLELQKEGTKNSVVPGSVADALGYRLGKESVVDSTEITAGKVISIQMAEDVDFACTEAGTIMTYKFTVKEDAKAGDIALYFQSDAEGGFSVSGTKPGEGGMTNVDSFMPRYLNTNLDELTISAPAESVKFEGITGVTLDTATNKQKDVSTFVVIDPEDCTELDTMTWKSENTAVATVANGVITAVGKGTTNIVVTVGNVSAKLPVTVTVPLTGVEFNGIDKVELDLTTNKTLDVSGNVKLLPADAEAAGYEWSIDDTAVATVANGVVTAVGKGTATLTVKVGTFTDTLPVEVTASVGSVAFDIDEVVLDTAENNTMDLSDKIVTDPANADIESITWESSDEEVVTVDENGVVTVVGKGEATITVTVDGKTATVPVSVTVPLTSITVDKTEVEVFKGDVAKVVVTANPEGAKWTTLDASFRSGNEFATVKSVEDGVEITGLAAGEAQIAIVANKGTTDELVKLVDIVVKENKVTDFEITVEDDITIKRGETNQLGTAYETEIPETEHATTDDTTVTWSSSDETIATVDENGLVTGHKEGDVTITATMAGFTATYETSVYEIKAEEIVFSEDTIAALEKIESVLVGDRVEVPFEIAPEDCTDTAEEIVEFVKTSFDEELVDVEVTYDKETGKGMITVTALKAGEAEVIIIGGEIPEDPEEEVLAWYLTFLITEPVVEEETPPATGDMPVALYAGLMAISLAGIVVSKKVLVK